MAAPVALLSRPDCAAGNPIQQGQFVPQEPSVAFRNQFRAMQLGFSKRLRGPPIAAANVAELAMTILKWALIFLLISIVAGVLGFTGISAASADIARFLFYVFVVIFLVLLILGLTIFRA